MIMAVFTPLAFLIILVFSSFTSIYASNLSNLTNALDQAIYAQKVASLEAKNHTKNNVSEISALNDCSQFLDNTIYRLNLSIHDSNSTVSDKQTWLDMALANVETCTDGFKELAILDHPVLVLANNLSKSLSNAQDDEPSGYNDVPSWAMNAYKTTLLNDSVNFVVAKDGSGDGKTIKDAIRAAFKRKGLQRFVIYVKAGVYHEYVHINKSLKNILIFGDGVRKTIITGRKHAGPAFTTPQTATFGVEGDKFIARDITFRNTAGPAAGQAVAFLSLADSSAFYRCRFEGYQDTLFVHSGRQFYRECDIYGADDFIFGDGTAVFQKCNIYIRKPPINLVTITSHKRADKKSKSGFIIHRSRITSHEELNGVKAFLGRPWGPYSRTVVMKSFIDNMIDPQGWLSWDVRANVSDVYYAEYNNTGPGSSTENRVKWKGFHVITNRTEASKFTVKEFLHGECWLPSTNVPYDLGI